MEHSAVEKAKAKDSYSGRISCVSDILLDAGVTVVHRACPQRACFVNISGVLHNISSLPAKGCLIPNESDSFVTKTMASIQIQKVLKHMSRKVLIHKKKSVEKQISLVSYHVWLIESKMHTNFKMKTVKEQE